MNEGLPFRQFTVALFVQFAKESDDRFGPPDKGGPETDGNAAKEL